MVPSCLGVAGKGTSKLPMGCVHVPGLVLSGHDASLKNGFRQCQGGWQGELEAGSLIAGTKHVRL